MQKERTLGKREITKDPMVLSLPYSPQCPISCPCEEEIITLMGGDEFQATKNACQSKHQRNMHEVIIGEKPRSHESQANAKKHDSCEERYEC